MENVHQSVFMSSVPATPSQEGPAFWDYHAKLLPGVSEVRGEEVKGWDVERVSAFVGSLPGCEEPAKYFREQVSDKICLYVMRSFGEGGGHLFQEARLWNKWPPCEEHKKPFGNRCEV